MDFLFMMNNVVSIKRDFFRIRQTRFSKRNFVYITTMKNVVNLRMEALFKDICVIKITAL